MPQLNRLVIVSNLLQNEIVTMAEQIVEHLHLNDLNMQTFKYSECKFKSWRIEKKYLHPIEERGSQEWTNSECSSSQA